MTKLNASNPIVESNLTMTQAFRREMIRLDDNLPIVGTGTPEGSLEAPQFSLFIDRLTGTEYRKLQAEVGSDRTLGWSQIGGSSGFTPTTFQAIKSGTQTTTGTATDLTGWTFDVSSADVTLDSGLGEFTFNTNGVFLVSCHVIGEDVAGANSRCELNIKMQVNKGSGYVDLPGALDSQYAIRNNSQDQGSAQFNNYALEVESGDKVKVQVFDVGIAVDILSNRARLTMLKVG
jgi:hypothetical protein